MKSGFGGISTNFIISDILKMSGLALSGGTLLSVLQGKKVYQPIWQIIAINNSQCNENFSSQILLSDGESMGSHCEL